MAAVVAQECSRPQEERDSRTCCRLASFVSLALLRSMGLLVITSGAMLAWPQVQNNTELPIDVGVQTPMGLVMEPQALGVVQPGRTFWLPVLRAEGGGLLCVRPSAGAAHSALALLATPPSLGTGDPGVATAAAAALEAARSMGTTAAALEAARSLGGGLSRPSSPAPPISPGGVLYSSGRLSPSRLSLDRTMIQQLEAAAAGQQAQQQGHPGAGGGGGSVHSSHAAFAALHAPRHDWSTAVALQQLLRPGAEGALGSGGGSSIEAHRPTRQLVCHPIGGSGEEQLPVIFSMGATQSGKKERGFT